MRIVVSNQISLRDVLQRLKQSQAQEIELVFADESVMREHAANLSLIKRYAAQLGKRLMLQESEYVEENSGVSEGQASDGNASQPGSSPRTDSRSTSSRHSRERDSSRFSVSPRKVVVFFVLLLLLTAGGVAAYVYYYLPKADVTLYVAERVLERSSKIKLDTRIDSTQRDKKILPAKKAQAAAEAKDTFAATGRKQVGEKARGTVKVYNFTQNSLTLSAGQVLTLDRTSGSFQYTLLEAVEVPRGVRVQEEIDPGISKQVEVEAVDIGADYNLVSNYEDRELVIDKYSTQDMFIYARPASAFEGGLTREITIISEEDRQRAKQQVEAAAEQKAKEKLKETVQEDFEEKTVKTVVAAVRFSHQVGDEVEDFTATARARAEVIPYSRSEVKKLLSREIQESVPQGFKVSSEDGVLTVQGVKQDSADTLSLQVKVTNFVVPVLDKAEIKRQLLGMSPSAAESYLQGIEYVKGYNVKLWPLLPQPFRHLPYRSERLNIQVEIRDGAEGS